MLVAEAHAPTRRRADAPASHLRHELDRFEHDEVVDPVSARDLVHLVAEQLPVTAHRGHQLLQLAGQDVAGLPQLLARADRRKMPLAQSFVA